VLPEFTDRPTDGRYAPAWAVPASDTTRSIGWLSAYTQSGMASVGGVKAKGADLQNRRGAIGPRTTKLAQRDRHPPVSPG